MNEGRIIEDDEIKDAVNKTSYRKWLDENFIAPSKVPYIPIIQH
jgi:hypothetical protein